MGIDAGIYSQYLKPPKSVADYDAEYAQGEANKLNALIGRQNLGLNNLKMDEYKRGVERSNALRDVTGRSATLPADQRINALRVGGFGAEADAAEKSWLERQKAEAEIRSKGIDDAKKRIEMMASSSKFVVDNPSYESLVAQSRFLIENGLLKPEQAEAALASAKDMTPEQIKAKAMLGFQSAIDADKQLPKTDSANLGGSMSFGATSPITGIRTETGSAPITESANNIADNLAKVAEGDKNRAVQTRGQDMTDRRSKEKNAIDSGAAVADAGGPNQAPMVKRFGKPPPGYRWKADGSGDSEAIPGGPADIKAGEKGEKDKMRQAVLSEQAKTVLTEIADAKKLTGWTTAGPAGLVAKLPMTDARKLAGHVETIKANLGFDRLQQMRDMSPTGGALGQVAVQEINYLQSTVSKLDQLQDPRDVMKALEKIEGHYTKWQKTLGGEPDKPTPPAAAQTATNPQTGEKIIYKDGKWVPLK